MSPWELRGLSRLCDHLEVVGYNLTNISRVNKEERLRIKKTIPEGLKNVQKLVRKLKERIKAERKRCKTASALTGDNDINDDDDGVEDNAEDGREGITEVSSGDAPPKPPPNPSQPIKLHLTLNSSSSSSSSVHSSPKATSMVTAINNNPTTGVANGDMKIKLFVVKEVLMSSSPASVNRSITYEDSDDWDSDMTEMEILDSEDPDDVVADVDDDSDVERGEEAAVSGGGDDDDDEKEWNSRKKRRTGSNTKDTSSITAGNKLSIPNTTKSALASTTSSSATMIKIIPTSSLITASTNNNNNAPMISKLKLNVGSLETPLTYNINWARKEEDENEEAGSDSSESDSGDEESASVDEEDGDGDVEEDDSAARQSFPKIRLKVTAQASIPSRQRSPVKKKRKLSSRYNNNNDVWTVRNHSVSTKPRPEQPITNNTDNANIPESNSVDNLQKTATAATSTTSSSSSLDQMFSFSPLPASSKPAAVVSKSTIVAQSHCPPGSDAALQRKKASKGKVFSKLLKTLKR